MIRLLAAGLAVALLTGPAAAAHPVTTGPVRLAPAVPYSPPVQPVRVVRAFEPPPGPYAAGHRGVDLATVPGERVSAAAAGTVAFAGTVAGRGLVVVAHADGIRTEYEPITPLVRAGQVVARGQPVGRVAGTHGACPPGGCLHWGARRGDRYLDPLALLRPLGPVRLLPWAAPP
jgi:murein DD-endopeptidase MepM/ murein hydrolase activator NlpD